MTTPIGAVALVFSHLAAIPAFVFLLQRRAWTTLTVLCVSVAMSTAYHVCQVGWACFGTDVGSLQRADHFMVYFAITWFLMWGVGASEELVASATIVIMGVALPYIIANSGWMASIAPIVAAVIGFVSYAIYACIKGTSKVNWLPLVAALILVAAGSVFYLLSGNFNNADSFYAVAHPVWHLYAMFSLYFAAMVRYWQPHVQKRSG